MGSKTLITTLPHPLSKGLRLRSYGWTLIELLFSLILISGLLVASLSSLSSFIQKNELQNYIDELSSAIQYAKIQAIILGHPVYLAPLDSLSAPNNEAVLSWSNSIVLKTKNAVIYQWRWQHPDWLLTWFGLNAFNKIIFSNNPIQAISNGHFRLLNQKTKKEVILTLNRLGKLKIKDGGLNPGFSKAQG